MKGREWYDKNEAAKNLFNFRNMIGDARALAMKGNSDNDMVAKYGVII